VIFNSLFKERNAYIKKNKERVQSVIQLLLLKFSKRKMVLLLLLP